MNTLAVVLEKPHSIVLNELELASPQEDDVVVDVEWSGISSGTEKLLWSGRMPHFPGMGYPLVPGYEWIGRVTAAGEGSGHGVGELVFVPGANCFGDVRGLFGGTASRLVVPGHRALPIDEDLGKQGLLLALAATAQHAVSRCGNRGPELIVGHGVLGRLLARLTILASGAAPVVWEREPARRNGADGYAVIDPADDGRRDYRTVCDVSGDSSILDALIARLAPGGEITLAGFYSKQLCFAFPPAFMREVRFQVAAQWSEEDLIEVKDLAECGALSLDDLITHEEAVDNAVEAYETAFHNPSCLKMVLDWRQCQ